jgi:hypothetical protein
MIVAAIPPVQVIVAGGPSITDWITAVTGAVALIVAVVAVWPAWRQLRMLVEDREREQAAGFAMWAEYPVTAQELQILYANSHAVPVYDVHGQLTMNNGKRRASCDMATVGPTASPVVDRPLSQLVNILLEDCLREQFGERVDQTNEYGDPHPPDEVLMDRNDLIKSVRVSVTFRDTTGVTWQRMPDGRLAKEPQSRRNWVSLLTSIRRLSRLRSTIS